MPLYEYHCNDCGEDFDKLVNFTQSDEQQSCPGCGSGKTYKKISRPVVLGGNSSGLTGSNCGSGGGFT